MDLELLGDIAARLCARRGWDGPTYIDNGASAAVYEVRVAGRQSALKIYDPAYFQGANALIEARRIELQRELIGHGCPHLVEVFEAAEISDDQTWFLLMEFCPWKSLDKKLAIVPDEKVHALLKQLVGAVQYLDAKGLVHRDIKPANIVVSDDFEILKLLDFGVLRRTAYDEGSGTEGHRFIATAQYSPPEFLGREEAPGEDGFGAINVYQIGAVLHDLIMKSAIFAEEKATKNRFILFKAITDKRPRIVSASVPPRLIALCSAALDKDPALRSKSVKLDDFLADADDLEALRRRVARSTSRASQVAPLLASWRPKILSWGRAAAQQESATLGPFIIRPQKIPVGLRWSISFAAADAQIYLEAVPVKDVLTVRVKSAPEAELGAPAFVITGDGPSIPDTGIPSALAAQFLYAVDLAVTAQAALNSGVSE